MTHLDKHDIAFSSNSSVYIRELEIDDLAQVYYLGEELFTSDLYPYLYRTWDQWEVIGLYNTDLSTGQKLAKTKQERVS